MKKVNQAAIYAKQKHNMQTRHDGDKIVPYFNHCKAVYEIVSKYAKRKDFNVELAQTIALLHDTLEDTNATYSEIEQLFSKQVADGVLALTKDDKLPKSEQMLDSLKRILNQPKEVAMVKMADRMHNISKINPIWNKKRSIRYYQEAILIHSTLSKKYEPLAVEFWDYINKYKLLIETYNKNGGFMKYLKVKHGYLFAYDEESGITLKFVDENWKLSEMTYAELSNSSDVVELTYNEASLITEGKNPKQLIDNIINILGL